MDMLNVTSTGMYTTLALIVKSKENVCKIMNVIAKISRYLERSVVTLKLRKEYLNTVTHNTSGHNKQSDTPIVKNIDRND